MVILISILVVVIIVIIIIIAVKEYGHQENRMMTDRLEVNQAGDCICEILAMTVGTERDRVEKYDEKT